MRTRAARCAQTEAVAAVGGLDTPQVWLSEERAVSLTDAPLLDFCPGTRFARPEKSS